MADYCMHTINQTREKPPVPFVLLFTCDTHLTEFSGAASEDALFSSSLKKQMTCIPFASVQ